MSRPEAEGPRRRKPSLARLALFGALACALCLALLEGVSSYALFAADMLRSASLGIAESVHTKYDPDLGWSNVANYYRKDMYGPGIYFRTNSRGFRSNRETPDAKPAGKYRVVCSGDSMTLGYVVNNDANWCQLLEGIDSRLVTVNMGQGGYGADQAYLSYRRDGQKLQHDIQVFAVIGDDFERMQKPQFIGYGRPVLKMEGSDLVAANTPVPKTSSLKKWLALNRPQIEKLRTVQFIANVTGQSHRLWSADQRLKRPIQATAEKKQLVSKMLEILSAINRSKGSQLLLVYLPVRTEYVSNATYFKDAPGPPPSPEWQAYLEEEASRIGIRYLNLVPEFQSLSEHEVDKLYIWDRAEIFQALPGHYSEEGNRFVAERIYARVRDMLDTGEPFVAKAQLEAAGVR